LDALLHPDATRDTFVDQYRERVLPLLMRETLIVLHGAATKPAAMDVESRLTEAALANVQLADFRNFAHGRHHWLARHSESSAVLAFAEERDEISRRTLSLIPSSIPRWQVSVEPGVRGALVAVYHSLLLAAIGGITRGYDPGRPHVPAFGRKLYQLRVISKVHHRADDAVERTNLAIERKAGMPVAALSFRKELDGWLKYYRAFIERLAKAQIRAIVLDYDGTLCAPDRRFEGPSADVVIRLNSLIDAGVTVAVATGRGKSVREALCQLILPQHRERLIVGYHNGAEIATLADSTCPTEKRPVVQEFAILAVSLQHSSTICNHATVEAKGKQISLELLPAGNAAVVFDEAVRIVQKTGPTGISLVTSDHSVDIIAPGVSKSNVVEEVIRRLDLAIGEAVSVLCIGDRGRAPGNDADLLRYPLSLSVDEVSSDFATCWNIAEPGLRFDSACFEYLTRLCPDRAGMRFDTKGMQP
jgi:hydroxymethylpyrimidine pyrophosphatase-like HAD family hydrolase